MPTGMQVSRTHGCALIRYVLAKYVVRMKQSGIRENCALKCPALHFVSYGLRTKYIDKGKIIKTLAFQYKIRRSQRAKKTRIVVTAEKIEVVAPLRVSARKIHAFVESQQDWIVAATDKIVAKKQKISRLSPEFYTDGIAIPYQGKQTRISLKSHALNSGTLKKVKIEFNEQQLNIYLPAKYEGENNSELIRLSLIDWMKKQAFKTVNEYVVLHTHKYNLTPRYIKIKTQKSRWGSCGIHNDINLNWLLMLAPPEVMEYVVVHELCHIKERNHSARFWQLLAAHLPDYQRQRNWLRQNGMSLMQGL